MAKSSARAPIPVALVGASGYTGAELLRLLYTHPTAQVVTLCGHSRAGEPLDQVLPSFTGCDLPDIVRFDPTAIAKHAEYAFLALPHKTAQNAAASLLDAGVKVIDLSADHRFTDSAFYEGIYQIEHAHPASLAQTVYGLPEHNRDRIRDTRLVGCPGCFPTSVILAAAPALHAGLLGDREIIADSKSGVTGAGRKPGAGTHFPETSEGIRAYKTFKHRHAPEIRHHLGEVKVHFVPHLVPMNRGILSTVYLKLRPGIELAEVRAAYAAAYENEPFVHVLPTDQHPETRQVRGTNRCHIGLFVDGDRLVVQAAIDNLGKGAAGQAIQCFNLMAGLDETVGLAHTALFP